MTKKYDSLILEFKSKEIMEQKSMGLVSLCSIIPKYKEVILIKLSDIEIQLIGTTDLIYNMKEMVLNNTI